MKLVLLGLVMIASGQIHTSESEYTSSESEFVPLKKDVRPVRSPLKNRRILIGSNKHGSRKYLCGRDGCGHIDYFGQMTNHRHNICFSKPLPCHHCPPGNVPTFLKAGAIFAHLTANHADLPEWKCIGCYSDIKKENFRKHFGAATFKKEAVERFSDMHLGQDEDILIGKTKLSLKKLREAQGMPNPAPFACLDEEQKNIASILLWASEGASRQPENEKNDNGGV